MAGNKFEEGLRCVVHPYNSVFNGRTGKSTCVEPHSPLGFSFK